MFHQLDYCKLRNMNDIVNFIRACCVLYNMSIDDEFDFEQEQIDPLPERVYPQLNEADLELDDSDGVAFRLDLVHISSLSLLFINIQNQKNIVFFHIIN